MQVLLDDAVYHSVRLSRSSPEYQEMISRRREYYVNFDSLISESFPQAVFMRAGLQNVQPLFIESCANLSLMDVLARDLTANKPVSWDLIAELEGLSTINYEIAKTFMPDELKDASSRWGNSTTEEQIVLCRQVYDALLSERYYTKGDDKFITEEPSDYWIPDYQNQPPSRIFPLEFLQLNKIEPNCFGKAQMLVAFAKQAGAKHYGATPVTTAQEVIHPTLVTVMAAIGHEANRRGIELSPKLDRAFRKRKASTEAIFRAPNRFHMALVIQLNDGSWYYIDPHMRSLGPIDNPTDMAEVPKVIDYLCPVLPGFAATVCVNISFAETLAVATTQGSIEMEQSHHLRDKWAEYDFEAKAALPLLARSKSLETLVNEGVGVTEDEKESFLRALAGDGFIQISFRAEHGKVNLLNFSTNSGREISPQMRSRLQIAAIVLNAASGGKFLCEDGLKSNLPIVDGMNKCFTILQSIAYRKVGLDLGLTSSNPGMVHPVLELYEPDFRIGLELVAHLNSVGKQSNQVIMELAQLCGGQHHLVLAAAEPLRINSKEMSEASSDAVNILRRTSVLLHSGEEVLRTLEEGGYIESISKSVVQ